MDGIAIEKQALINTNKKGKISCYMLLGSRM